MRQKKNQTALFAGILLLASSPLFASAGVFSFLSDFFQGGAAETTTQLKNSQTAPLISVTLSSEEASSTKDALMESEPGSVNLLSGPLRNETETEVYIPSSDEISLYVVRQGDTLSTIAKLYNVTQNTIVWANNLKSKKINPGDTLVILPVSGVRYTIKKGDTLKTLAKKYKGDIEEIALFNGLASDALLAVGSTIIIPDGEIVEAATPVQTTPTKPAQSYAGYYIRPIVGGTRTQGIHGRNGVDLAAPMGTLVRASAAGTVIISREGGWNGGYGNYVVVLHGNGTQTLYAHLLQTNVKVGNVVAQGETIGFLGNTGKSSGPHVHFEIRGGPRNPF